MEIAVETNTAGVAVIAVYTAAAVVNTAVIAEGTAVSVADIAVSVANTAEPVEGIAVTALYIVGIAADTVESTVEHTADCVDWDIAVNTAGFASERYIAAAGTADNFVADSREGIVESSAD